MQLLIFSSSVQRFDLQRASSLFLQISPEAETVDTTSRWLIMVSPRLPLGSLSRGRCRWTRQLRSCWANCSPKKVSVRMGSTSNWNTTQRSPAFQAGLQAARPTRLSPYNPTTRLLRKLPPCLRRTEMTPLVF